MAQSGPPPARVSPASVGAALALVALVLLLHGWTLQAIARRLGQFANPLPETEIRNPLITRALVLPPPASGTASLAAPGSAPPKGQQHSRAAPPAPARPPVPAATPQTLATPTPPASIALAVSEPAPATASASPLPGQARPSPGSVEPAAPQPDAPAPAPLASPPPSPPPAPLPVATPEPPVRDVPATLPAPAPLPAVLSDKPAAAQPVPAASVLPEPAAAVATSAAPPPRPLAWPASMGLAYQLEINAFPLPARAELRWRHDGAHYEASLSLLSLLSIVRTSKGAMTPQGLEPLRYGEKITARGETAVHFQRDKGLVSFSNNKPSLALLPGVQDELSVFFQIAAMLGGDPREAAPGTEIAVQTVESRAARKLVFVVGASQMLDLPGGRTQTVYLSHAEPPNYEGSRGSKGELWLAPGLDYLPVRIRITEPSGTMYDLRWSQTLPP